MAGSLGRWKNWAPERKRVSMAWTEVIELSRCRDGAGTFVEVSGLELAVFRLCDPERLVVIDNACPHASGNLSGGEVTRNRVRCPSHEWEFDLDRGVCTQSSRATVHRYPVELREGVVWANLPNASE